MNEEMTVSLRALFGRKNLPNAAYPEIVFCYIAWKFAYLYCRTLFCILFSVTVFVRIVLQRAHEDAHLFFLYFFSCHVLCFLFCFNAQADYYILILARKKNDFHFTAPSKGLFCFNARVIKLYFIVSHYISLVFYLKSRYLELDK